MTCTGQAGYLCTIAPNNVGLVWVHIIREYLEALKTAIAQLVLWKHAGHGAAQNLLRLLLHERAELDFFQAARVHRVVPVQLFFCFLARHCDVLGIGDDDVIAHIFGRIVDRLVLAHQRRRDGARKPTKHALTRIKMVPHACECERCLRLEAVHVRCPRAETWQKMAEMQRYAFRPMPLSAELHARAWIAGERDPQRLLTVDGHVV